MHTRRFSRLAARTFLAGALLAGAACGDDDDGTAASGDAVVEDTTEDVTEDAEDAEDATEDTTAPSGEGEQAAGAGGGEAFCTGLVEFNSAVMMTDLSEDASEADIMAAGEQLAPSWEQVRENAPEELQDVIEELSTSVDALAEGDAEGFNADETFETYSGMLTEAIPSCDFESVSITGVDYAYEGVPDTMEAGTVALEFTNASEEEEHEIVVFKKNDPNQSTEELFGMPEEEAMAAITFAGASFAPPGESSSSLLTLEPGSYTAVCFIPVGGADEGPPHFTQGMSAEFTVE